MAKRKGNILASLTKEECKLEMTPMIDVTFLLLIFFMCTLKFKTLEGKLSAYLPKDVGVNQDDAEPKEKIEIRLDVRTPGIKIRPGRERVLYTAEDESERRRFVYDETREVVYSIGPRKTSDLGEVRQSLKAFYAQDSSRPMTIDARAGITVTDVVKLLDVALDVEFTDITFVGSYEK